MAEAGLASCVACRACGGELRRGKTEPARLGRTQFRAEWAGVSRAVAPALLMPKPGGGGGSPHSPTRQAAAIGAYRRGVPRCSSAGFAHASNRVPSLGGDAVTSLMSHPQRYLEWSWCQGRKSGRATSGQPLWSGCQTSCRPSAARIYPDGAAALASGALLEGRARGTCCRGWPARFHSSCARGLHG